jgi:membrane protein YqaA with SNARE-associated domain
MSLAQEPTTPEATPAEARRPGPLKRLYLWVLSWAEHPSGTWALAGLSFAESSFFPIPPDVLQIALSVAKPKRALWYALVSTLASVLGGILGFYIGMAFWDQVSGFFFEHVPGFTQHNFDAVQQKYEGNAFPAILIAAFTPIPYKVFTISAGIFDVALSTLILASIVGRGARFFLVGTLIFFFGPTVKHYLDRYLELATVLLVVIGTLGFLAVKYLL